MSLEIIATIICDTCGAKEFSETCRRFTHSKLIATEHKSNLEKRGWQVVSRGRFHREAHVCPQCLDKPLPKIAGKPRWKGPEITDEIRAQLKHIFSLPNHTVWIAVEGKKTLILASPCIFLSKEVTVTWRPRRGRKTIEKDQIEGWITNESLVEILGYQPAV